MGRPLERDVRRQAVVARDRAGQVSVAGIAEGSGATGHPQILEAILGQGDYLGRAPLWEAPFQGGDTPREEYVTAELDDESLAEIQHAAVGKKMTVGPLSTG